MKPITSAEFRSMFRPGTRAWHLELRDTYHVEDEDVPFDLWLRGIPDDFAWRRDWLSFMSEVTSVGTQVQRLRIVTEPLSDYMRWAMALDPGNIEAGEEVRYLPRAQVAERPLPAEDCWLFDDHLLVLSLFKPDGRGAGYAVEDDPEQLTLYRATRDDLWSRAVPYAEYHPATT